MSCGNKKKSQKTGYGICLKDNSNRIDHAGRGIFLKKDAAPEQTIRNTRKRPVVCEPATAATQATQKAVVDAVIAITAVCSEVLKISGSTEIDCADGKKFLTSQYSPRGIPVSAFHAVNPVIIAEAVYNAAAVKKIVNVLSFFFLKKASEEGDCRC